jgi:hypothetical protein
MPFSLFFVRSLLYVFLAAMLCSPARAQESPYFVTYDHYLEEPGNLELEMSSTLGVPRSGQRTVFAPYAEFEYGVTSRWTSELYLEAQSTSGDSTVFTGWRWENRFRPLKREHIVNPVLYLEYENINEASRILKEIVGNAEGSGEPNAELRQAHAHELEAKLILSGKARDWNLAGNFIFEKNVSQNEGLEFGYALGTWRSLSSTVSANQCRWCRENFTGGIELYGGLGSTRGFCFHETAHYAAPVLGWRISDNASVRFSPAIGLTSLSNPLLLRFGYSYEIRGFRDKVAMLFRGRP